MVVQSGISYEVRLAPRAATDTSSPLRHLQFHLALSTTATTHSGPVSPYDARIDFGFDIRARAQLGAQTRYVLVAVTAYTRFWDLSPTRKQV